MDLAAGQKKTPRRLYVAGAKAPRGKVDVSKRKRRKLTVMMVVRLGQPNFVVPLSGSKYEGMPELPSYTNEKGASTNDLTAKEYAVKLGEYVSHVKAHSPRQGRSRARVLQVYHDRDSAHGGPRIRKACADLGLQTAYLPARDADLNPLDYGIFGAVKSAWHKRVEEERIGWDESCKLFLDMLQEVDAETIIRALPGRMKACIAKNGWPFEWDYRKGHWDRGKAKGQSQ